MVLGVPEMAKSSNRVCGSKALWKNRKDRRFPESSLWRPSHNVLRKFLSTFSFAHRYFRGYQSTSGTIERFHLVWKTRSFRDAKALEKTVRCFGDHTRGAQSLEVQAAKGVARVQRSSGAKGEVRTPLPPLVLATGNTPPTRGWPPAPTSGKLAPVPPRTPRCLFRLASMAEAPPPHLWPSQGSVGAATIVCCLFLFFPHSFRKTWFLKHRLNIHAFKKHSYNYSILPFSVLWFFSLNISAYPKYFSYCCIVFENIILVPS